MWLGRIVGVERSRLIPRNAERLEASAMFANKQNLHYYYSLVGYFLTVNNNDDSDYGMIIIRVSVVVMVIIIIIMIIIWIDTNHLKYHVSQYFFTSPLFAKKYFSLLTFCNLFCKW